MIFHVNFLLAELYEKSDLDFDKHEKICLQKFVVSSSHN